VRGTTKRDSPSRNQASFANSIFSGTRNTTFTATERRTAANIGLDIQRTVSNIDIDIEKLKLGAREPRIARYAPAATKACDRLDLFVVA
jgi:hypothetical protein